MDENFDQVAEFITGENGIIDSLLECLETEIQFCRICRLNDCDGTNLIQLPCDCKGSVGYIHLKCYRIWRTIRRRKFCEICKKPFGHIKDDRPLLTIFWLRLYRLITNGYLLRTLKSLFRMVYLFPLLNGNIVEMLDLGGKINLFHLSLRHVTLFSTFLCLTNVLLTCHVFWMIENYIKFCRVALRWWDDIDEELPFNSIIDLDSDSPFDSLLEIFLDSY